MRRLIYLVLLCFLTVSAHAQEVQIGPGDVSSDYIFDAIKRTEIRKPISAMLDGQNLPAWAMVTTNNNYVAGAPRTVNSPMKGATIYGLCKPHDCGDNSMRILLAADKAKAYAVLQESGKRRYFGSPDAVAKSVLDASLVN